MLTAKMAIINSRHKSDSIIILQVLLNPEILLSLSLQEWDRMLPIARHFGVLGSLQTRLAERGLLEQVPSPVRTHLEAAGIIAADHERMIRWEVNRIQRALADTRVTPILLKGAAYVLAGLPCARGRLVADVDLLVSREQLPLTEQALHSHGWVTVKQNVYDQHYYRRWMHELPPLQHRLRGTIVDVHHNILPQTNRLKVNPLPLLADAQPIAETSLRVLAPVDMVLHSAVHTFQDGDLANYLRDLLDFHELLSHFGKEYDFWNLLVQRAYALNLVRPLYYAVRYSRCFLRTQIPPATMTALKQKGPVWPVQIIMDALVGQTLYNNSSTHWEATIARRLLYLRSHWLRMPPLLLSRHLLYKAFTRLQSHVVQPHQP
jgi:hypothetical protein